MTLLRGYLHRVQGPLRLKRALLTLWLPITIGAIIPILPVLLSSVSLRSAFACLSVLILGAVLWLGIRAIPSIPFSAPSTPTGLWDNSVRTSIHVAEDIRRLSKDKL